MKMFQFFNSAMCAFAYRIRGGGWFQFGSDIPVRIMWGFSLCVAYALNSIAGFPPIPNVIPAYLALIIPLAYLSMLVPHGYCMNMGRWLMPQKKYPSFWLPTLEDAEWSALPIFWRTAYDFSSMASVAALRAIIVFAPFILATYLTSGGVPVPNFLRAAAVLVIGQPISYLVGWYVPFSIGSSLTKRSTEWAEFFNGAVWALAMGQL